MHDILGKCQKVKKQPDILLTKIYRNPSGVADGFLLEAWVQVQRKGLVNGPYYNKAAAGRQKAGRAKSSGSSERSESTE